MLAAITVVTNFFCMCYAQLLKYAVLAHVGRVNDHTTHGTLLLTASYAQCTAVGELDRQEPGCSGSLQG
jgi:hypothetical protein